MGFGTPPTVLSCAEDVLPCLEGDYSDWTIYDSFADPDHTGTKHWDVGSFNKDETKLVILDSASGDNGVLKIYDIATKTLDSVLTRVSTRESGPMWKSILGTYTIVCWASVVAGTLNRVSILKDGVVIKTFTDAQLGMTVNTIMCAFTSYSGKYVVASGYLPAPVDSWGWVVLVGS